MDERNDGAREGFAEDGSDEESEQEGDPDEDYTTTAAQTSSYGKEVKGLYGVDDVLPEEEFGEITIAGMVHISILSLDASADRSSCVTLELYELLKANCINLNPAYQREPVVRFHILGDSPRFASLLSIPPSQLHSGRQTGMKVSYNLSIVTFMYRSYYSMCTQAQRRKMRRKTMERLLQILLDTRLETREKERRKRRVLG